MEHKDNNPLAPLKNVRLRPEDKTKIREDLLHIMHTEEPSLPSFKPVIHRGRNRQRIFSILAGVASVMLVAGVLITGQQNHWFQTTMETAQRHPTTSHPVKPLQTNTGVPFSHLGAKSLNSVSFITNNIGFVAGKDGIYKTTDGGNRWTQVYTSKAPILGIEAKYQPTGKEEYVVAWTKTHLIRSIDGTHFTIEGVGGNTGGGSGTQIEDASLLNNNMIYLLNKGVVWASAGESGALIRRTPKGTVSSVSATWDTTNGGMAVCYATIGTSVFKTTYTNGQWIWTKVFTAPVKHEPNSWHATVEANGSHVWLLVKGGQENKKTGEEAYVIFASNDGGSTWQPMAANQDYKAAYPTVHLPSAQNIGQEPLSMNVLSSGEAVFAARDTVVGKTLISHIGPGKNQSLRTTVTYATQPNAFNAASTVGIFFADQNHGWIVGSKQSKGYVYATNDGGLQWTKK